MPTREEILRELESRRDEMSPLQVQQLDAALARFRQERQAAALEPTAAVPETPPIGGQEKTLGGFAGNILPSAGRLAGDVASLAAHPIETAKGIGRMATGVAGQGGPFPTLPPELVTFFNDRYGSLDAALETLYEDPVGVLADVSSVLGGGGGALRGAAALTKAGSAGRLGRVGQAVSKAGAVSDPIALAGSAASAVGRKPLRFAVEYAGAGLGAMTGAGTEAVRVAATRNTKSFRDAMRTKVGNLDIVNDVRDGLHELRTKRGQAYREELSKISKSNRQVSLDPLKKKIDKLLVDFRVAKTDEGLSFTDSAIGAEGQRTVARAVELVDGWQDTSLLGVDALKRRLGDFYTDSGQARAFVAQAEKTARGLLDDVPEYREMTRDYRTASELIDLIDKELSLSQQTGTTVRKLANALNQNNRYRQTILEVLDEASGTKSVEAVAGSAFADIAPRGIMRPLAGGQLLWSVGTGRMETLPALMLASPRMTGELLTAISAVRRGSAAVGRKVPGYPGAIAYRPLAAVETEQPDPLQP